MPHIRIPRQNSSIFPANGKKLFGVCTSSDPIGETVLRGLMKQKSLLIVGVIVNLLLLLLISTPLPALADPPPTATQRTFNASDLLTKIAPKAYATFSYSVQFQSAAPADSVVDGAAWMRTFYGIYTQFG